MASFSYFVGLSMSNPGEVRHVPLSIHAAVFAFLQLLGSFSGRNIASALYAL